ncbi:MAG: hypothetical protein AAF216_13750 [Pseudomonadota bacterium]
MATYDEQELMRLCKVQTRPALRRRLKDGRVPFMETGTIWTSDDIIIAGKYGDKKKKAAVPRFIAEGEG